MGSFNDRPALLNSEEERMRELEELLRQKEDMKIQEEGALRSKIADDSALKQEFAAPQEGVSQPVYKDNNNVNKDLGETFPSMNANQAGYEYDIDDPTLSPETQGMRNEMIAGHNPDLAPKSEAEILEEMRDATRTSPKHAPAVAAAPTKKVEKAAATVAKEANKVEKQKETANSAMMKLINEYRESKKTDKSDLEAAEKKQGLLDTIKMFTELSTGLVGNYAQAGSGIKMPDTRRTIDTPDVVTPVRDRAKGRMDELLKMGQLYKMSEELKPKAQKEEKPIFDNGQQMVKQPDGSYKAVDIPGYKEEGKVLKPQIIDGKQITVDKDGNAIATQVKGLKDSKKEEKVTSKLMKMPDGNVYNIITDSKGKTTQGKVDLPGYDATKFQKDGKIEGTTEYDGKLYRNDDINKLKDGEELKPILQPVDPLQEYLDSTAVNVPKLSDTELQRGRKETLINVVNDDQFMKRSELDPELYNKSKEMSASDLDNDELRKIGFKSKLYIDYLSRKITSQDIDLGLLEGAPLLAAVGDDMAKNIAANMQIQHKKHQRKLDQVRADNNEAPRVPFNVLKQEQKEVLYGIQKDIIKDKAIDRSMMKIAAANGAKALLMTDNKIAASAIPRLLARLSGEVGVMTDKDVASFQTIKAASARLNQLMTTWTSGELTIENRLEMIDMVVILEGVARKSMAKRLDFHKQKGEQLFDSYPKHVQKRFDVNYYLNVNKMKGMDDNVIKTYEIMKRRLPNATMEDAFKYYNEKYLTKKLKDSIRNNKTFKKKR